jgi:YihY family inner membrane protein
MAQSRASSFKQGVSGAQQPRRASRSAAENPERQPRVDDTMSVKEKLLAAFNKFNNDWTMNLAAMLSYNVLTSFFPLLLAILTILVHLPVALGSTNNVATQINQILPSNVRSQINVRALITNVDRQSGLLTIVSVVGLLWGGTNLFGAIESAFAIIFRVKTRNVVTQKLMAVLMILIFVILLPLSFASSVLLSFASTTLSKILPGGLSGPFAVGVGVATSLAALFALFLAVYMVVPNVPVRWRFAWRGALLAAIAMFVVNTVFPTYTAHFVSTKQYGAAAVATAIVTITWFWFFSVVLLLGAQINALTMGIGPWKYDLSRELMDSEIPVTSGQPTALDALAREHGRAALESPVGVLRDTPREAEQRAETPQAAPGDRRR